MVIAGHGLWRLLRSADLAPWRFLGAAAVGIAACLLIVGGRPYYLAGLIGLLIAAGAVGIEVHPPVRWWSWSVSGPALAASALIPVLLLPLGPPGWNPVERRVNASVEITPDVTAGLQAAYAGMPTHQREHTAVVA